jgi:septal ring factor EnvC (AmiA/AmiB activator)
MADPNVTQTWYGAIAAAFSAMVGFLGLWLVPKWAKRTELTRADGALTLDADVRSRADLIAGFNLLLLSQQKRIEQLDEQLEESVKDRDKLWTRIGKLTDEVSDAERKRSGLALIHFVELTAVKTQLADCRRELADLRNKQ